MTSLQDERRRARTPAVARDFVRSTNGWRAVSPESGDRCGLTAHRGVLHPDEYVNRAQLLAAVEAGLGFTAAELRSVYRQGRKSAAQRELRARVDARLLALSRSGANIALLGRVLGLTGRTLYRALGRARDAEASDERACNHLGRHARCASLRPGRHARARDAPAI